MIQAQKKKSMGYSTAIFRRLILCQKSNVFYNALFVMKIVRYVIRKDVHLIFLEVYEKFLFMVPYCIKLIPQLNRPIKHAYRKP